MEGKVQYSITYHVSVKVKTNIIYGHIYNFFQTPFENLARKMTDLTGNAGVLKKIIRQGEGMLHVVSNKYNAYACKRIGPAHGVDLLGRGSS